MMDCIDCHNRPTHIFHSAEEALDLQFVSGAMPEDLPYIKKVALEAVTRKYNSREEAKKKIAEFISQYYQKNYPDLFHKEKAKIDQAIKAAQEAYLLNVFPEMNIYWNTYTNFLGHEGCFRCHNEELESEDGEVISQDCSLCHNLLAEEEESPEILETLLGE